MSASTSHEPSHLSIGEVLNILREEFPDITISKIRFLESQGLIDPERTPSGYRKFYEADVSRLRWILHQQKENFLPLKVIKERLEQLGDAEQPAPVSALAPGSTTGQGQRRRARRSSPDPNVAPPLPFGGSTPNGGDDPPRPAPGRDDASRPVSPRQDASPPAPPPQDTSPPVSPPEDKPGLTRGELASAVGLEEWQLAELESFGLVTPVAYTPDDRDAFFDEQGQAIANAAAGFYAHGVGARHLRMYKHFAEREAALFAQVSLQYLRQRNPSARAKAQEELATLSRLGRALRAALLVQAIRDSLTE
jgi:DNA-binding transcriptional MerR regulator